MNILFDIGHPAHVHLFKNFITYLKKKNHKVVVTSRKKDVIINLLSHYDIDNLVLSQPGKSLFQMIFEILNRDFKILNLHKKIKFNLAFGTSVSIGHLSTISKVVSINFNEDDDAIVPLFTNVSYPFSDKIINPTCLKFTKWKKKRILHESYHELAYLHPNNFKPDKNILKKYDLSENKYIVIRHSALQAHHDKGVEGLSGNVWNNIEELVKDHPLVFSRENEKSHQIDPWDMHHILAFAKMVISDSQTMTAEAAVLGVPSVRYNSFAGRISYLEELEHKYKIKYRFYPGRDDKKAVEKVRELLAAKDLKTIWDQKRKKMLSEKIDLNQWMIDLFEKQLSTEDRY